MFKKIALLLALAFSIASTVGATPTNQQYPFPFRLPAREINRPAEIHLQASRETCYRLVTIAWGSRHFPGPTPTGRVLDSKNYYVAVERALFYLNFIAELALLGRLMQCRLYRTYGSLFLYWLMQALPSLALLSVRRQTRLYVYIYWGAQTMNMLYGAVFVVQDLFRIALAEHPAIASVGRRAVLAAMVLAAMVALGRDHTRRHYSSGALPGHSAFRDV